MPAVKLLVGLGNPGSEYEKTPHNAGFEIIRKFAENLKTVPFKRHKDSLVSFINIKGEKVILALPQLYMNNSGIAVRKLLNEFDLCPKDLIVCYDDLDLPFGTIKLRLSGGAGGHHGMESIISEIGTKVFPRIRIGVQNKAINRDETVNYLLSKLDERCYKLLLMGVEEAAEALQDALFKGWNFAMNKYNRKEESKSQNSI